MISRRSIVGAFGFGTFVPSIALTPLGTFAQQPPTKVWRIGFLHLGSPPTSGQRLEALRAGLRDLGYVEGKNIIIESRWGEGKIERIPELVAELVQLKPDVIVGSSGPVMQVLKKATSSIPIVIAASGDPVASGLVNSLARPGGNITGMSLMSTELSGKWLQFVRELVPGVSRVGLLTQTTSITTRVMLEQLHLATEKFKIALIIPPVAEAADLPGAFAQFKRERAQAVIVQITPVNLDQREQITKMAAQQRLVAVYEGSDFADAGALLSYGPNLNAMSRRAAIFVDKILKGAKPGDLPVEQPSQFELVLNLKTAKALGLKIPGTILLQATKVIE